MTTPFELNLRHLDALLGIATHGSINAASNAVNLSQPALTQALAKFETTLGVHLFERHPKGAKPTDAGRLFLGRAERAIDFIRNGGRRLRRSARLPPIAYFERIASMGHLHALVAVDKAGSYALAAREIGLSQPSVHRAVKELEAMLGMHLLVRTGRSMQTTPLGSKLVMAVRLMAAELQAGLDELAALSDESAATIRIGALPLPRSGLLPEALSRFKQAYPHSTVSIIEGPYPELLGALIKAEIDLVVGALRDPAPTRDILQHPLFEDDLFIVARTGHPLATKPLATPETISQYPWVAGAQGSPMRARWESLFTGTKLPPIRIDCSSIMVARGLLLNGDWLALMSRDQFRLEQAAGLLAPIGGPVPGSRRRIGLTVRKGWLPTSAQSALVGAIEAAAGNRSSAS